MRQTSLFFGDAYVQSYEVEESCERALIYFHGFPGPTADNPVQPLNKMLAEIGEELGFDVHAPRYPGLGESRGTFSFVKAIDFAKGFITALNNKGYTRITVLGYSFGALVALASSMTYRRTPDIILLAPFLGVPEGFSLEQLAKDVVANHPRDLRGMTVDQVEREFRVLRDEHAPRFDRLTERWGRTTAIVGAQDEVAPLAAMEAYVKPYVSRFEVLPDDHQFRDRLALKETIRHALRAP